MPINFAIWYTGYVFETLPISVNNSVALSVKILERKSVMSGKIFSRNKNQKTAGVLFIGLLLGYLYLSICKK